MKTVFLIIGTRPEAIKMAPIYHALKRRPEVSTTLICTGQHRELIDQALHAFDMVPNMNLGVMRPGQSLSGLTCSLLTALEKIFLRKKPDLVLAHGDTTTCFSAALSCFYHGVPIAHVEAGLRTYRLDSPFPEEFNRQSVAKLADFHFAPDQFAKENLLQEGIADSKISVTGTTAVDSVRAIQQHISDQITGKPVSIITLHRRERGQDELREMLMGLKEAAILHPEMLFIYPVHPSPVVRHAAYEVLTDVPNIRLSAPMEYRDFIGLMSQAKVVVTDSGGIQEEATYLGRRVLLLRERTERFDGLSNGQVSIVGTKRQAITRAVDLALSQKEQPFILSSSDESPSQKITLEVIRRLA
jgi:UDP-N-acetylglucosamine 2-epimerase (non-hydrolysing)